MDELAAGTVIQGRYLVEAYIASGGSATVYSARDLELPPKRVAVKVIDSKSATDPKFQKRFAAEAEIVKRITSPHIVRFDGFGIHHVNEHRKYFYFVTLLARTDFATSLKEDPPIGGMAGHDRITHVLGQVASALDAAHHAGVVHGDVKPANVLLFGGADERAPHAQLADFGVARELANVTPDTSPVLTAAYAPPEQWQGEVETASDQYALACSAFQALVGETPFGRSANLRAAHAGQPPPSAAARAGGRLPRAVDPVFARALAKEPTDRYPSCGEFVRELNAALAVTAPPRIKPTRPLPPARRRDRRAPTEPTAPVRGGRRRMPVVTALVVLTLAAAVAAALVNPRGETAGPSTASHQPYSIAALRELRARIPQQADGCIETNFARTPLAHRPAGIQAALTCPTGVPGQSAYYQRYASRLNIDDAFATLAQSASFSGGKADQVPCIEGDPASEPRSWENNTGSFVCLARGTEHWMVVSDVHGPLRIVAIVDHNALGPAVQAWIDRLRTPFRGGDPGVPLATTTTPR